MLDSYRTIKEDGQWEIDIKKSRFICFLQRVTTEEEARTMIQQIKKESRAEELDHLPKYGAIRRMIL